MYALGVTFQKQGKYPGQLLYGSGERINYTKHNTKHNLYLIR